MPLGHRAGMTQQALGGQHLSVGQGAPRVGTWEGPAGRQVLSMLTQPAHLCAWCHQPQETYLDAGTVVGHAGGQGDEN